MVRDKRGRMIAPPKPPPPIILRARAGYWVLCRVCDDHMPVGSLRRARAHPGICLACKTEGAKEKS